MARSKASEILQVARRPYWREADAQVIVDAWKGSGEVLSSFAARYGLDRKRVGRWVSRLASQQKRCVPFHPVRLVSAGGQREGHDSIEIVLTDGLRVKVPRGFEAEDLRRVLEVLGEGA